MTETCQHCDARLRTKHRQAADTPLCHDCTAKDGTPKDKVVLDVQDTDDEDTDDEDTDDEDTDDEDTDGPTGTLVEKTSNGWQTVH